MNRYTCDLARNPGEIREAQRLRFRVYGQEENMLPAQACLDGRERDARDTGGGAIHFIVRAGEEVVGTVRLLPASTGSTNAARLGLDLSTKLDLAALAAPGIVPAEITRFCVLRAYRGTGVTPALFAALRAESERRGITHWLAAANTETDFAEDALLAYQVARAKKLVNTNLRIAARGAAAITSTTARKRPFYTPAERLRARSGLPALAEMDLPRTLSAFARRMGARFTGEPFYEPDFGVFALPLVVVLAEADARVCTSTTYPVSPTGANAASRPPPSPGGGSS